VWRADAPGAAARPERVDTHKLLRAGFDQSTDAQLAAELGHADQRVRQGAQFELAKRGRSAELLGVAGEAKAPQLARIHALWGYGQLLRRGAAPADAVLPRLAEADDEIRAQTAKILGDAPKAAQAVAAKLIPLVADPAPRVRLQAAIALGKLAVPAAVDALVALAAKEGTESVMRHAAVTGLAGCATPAQLAALKSNPSLSVRLAAVVALRRQAAAEEAVYLTDADPAVVEEAVRAIHDDLSIPAALPAVAALIDSPAPRSDPILRRAINANLRLGTPEAAGRLLSFALDAGRSKEMRIEALTSLRVWATPPPLDRVDGRARKFNPAPVREVLEPRLAALLALQDPALKTLAIEIMIAHTLRAGADQIAAIVADAKAAAALRAQALRLLAGQDRANPAFGTTLDHALAADAPAPLHMAALELLLPDRAERLATEAQATLATRTVPEKQHALAQLALAAHPAADAVIDAQAAQLLAGKCPPTLQLDVIEAVNARAAANPALAARAKGFATLPTAKTHGELLEGGNVIAGRDIVANHLNANCLACHSITPGGSEVGPNLRAVGAQNPREYLLESLLDPAAKIAIGYGLVGITTRDGGQITGTLASETPKAVTVRLLDGTRKTVPRDQITHQTDPVTVMPPMGPILQPREIRDVVAYLASLKGGRARDAVVDEH
jgi:putative heme-binding domain-containing protein